MQAVYIVVTNYHSPDETEPDDDIALLAAFTDRASAYRCAADASKGHFTDAGVWALELDKLAERFREI